MKTSVKTGTRLASHHRSMTMKNLCALLLLFPLAGTAQTTHIVQSGGSTIGGAAPFYNPPVVTIAVGDIVRWTNVSGTHNVNGTTFHYPENPEEFYSGSPDNGLWSWPYTFTIPGTYHYTCDSKGHSATQVGTVIVEAGNSIAEHRGPGEVVLYPSPAEDHVMAVVGTRIVTRVEVLGMDGRLIAAPALAGTDVLRIPVEDLNAGNYLLRFTESNGTNTSVRFTKK
jgi:plastocyanin